MYNSTTVLLLQLRWIEISHDWTLSWSDTDGGTWYLPVAPFLGWTMMNHLSWRINNSMRSCQNATRLYTLALARLPLFLVMSHESEDVRSKIELRWSIIRDEYNICIYNYNNIILILYSIHIHLRILSMHIYIYIPTWDRLLQCCSLFEFPTSMVPTPPTSQVRVLKQS